MFCIVFEAKLWYCHQFFIVWKSNLWCFCIFCVVLEAKLRNYHMFWHFSSILHRVDHHFIMNMLFFLQFLHIFDPNLPTTPSVNWKFAVVSWLLGNHLHLKYGTSHAEKKKHGFHPSAAPTKGKRPGCTRKKVSTRNVHHVRNPTLQDVAAPVQGHGTKVCTKPRHASNMCSYREIRSHCF